jgi:GDPmannose 4,6-dehydratase
VRDIVERAFARVGLDPEPYVRSEESLRRGKAELHDLVGDPSKAERELGWRREVEFEGLIDLLVDADVATLERGRAVTEPGR